MRVRVVLEGPLARLAGGEKLVLDVREGATLLEALRALCSLRPSLSVLFDTDTGDPRTNFLLLLNGRDVDVLGGLETKLSEGDELCIIPLVRL
ncbi:molybdopterin synthase sulfur carrier subunit [Candidatus Bathyarchaeota archaeon]|nr:MAG: molybdopterin synthase sulfur carrier subunit [Candidatus Bathyarchaeota archaeon]